MKRNRKTDELLDAIEAHCKTDCKPGQPLLHKAASLAAADAWALRERMPRHGLLDTFKNKNFLA